MLNGHGGNTTALQNMIGELTVEYKLPLATGTYWDIAAKSIAGLLEKQKALLHACEAETSMIMAMAPELVNPDELSQMHGPYIPGLAAIPAVNEGVYRWRQLSSRSPIGVIGDAGDRQRRERREAARRDLGRRRRGAGQRPPVE